MKVDCSLSARSDRWSTMEINSGRSLSRRRGGGSDRLLSRMPGRGETAAHIQDQLWQSAVSESRSALCRTAIGQVYRNGHRNVARLMHGGCIRWQHFSPSVSCFAASNLSLCFVAIAWATTQLALTIGSNCCYFIPTATSCATRKRYELSFEEVYFVPNIRDPVLALEITFCFPWPLPTATNTV